ncbi:hypothetical protein ACOMHN_041146 [Nucella lapillus]
MGNSHPGSTEDDEDEAGAGPEALWLPFIREMYPDLHKEVYFLPPIHFHNAPHSVQQIAGQTVRVRENLSTKPKRRPKSKTRPSSSSSLSSSSAPQPPPQVPGTVFVENQRELQAVRIQDSDVQDDQAHEHCLQGLATIRGQVMMVISRLTFRKYLDNASNPERLTNPLHAAAVSLLPTLDDSTLPSHLVDGECDILLLHRRRGLVVGEIKSVGGGRYFSGQDGSKQNEIVVRKVTEALLQLDNQEAALRHLVSDLPPVAVTKTLLLPNLTAAQLRAALASCAQVQEALCRSTGKKDVSKAMRRCVCQDQMTTPAGWQAALKKQPDPHMTARLYERLVARFCGPASTVDIPTATCPRRVLRTSGQAAAETGLRYSELTLTPSQVDLLDRKHEPEFMYLHGPPGTGKTVVLVMKALQWSLQGKQVVILSATRSSDPITTLMETQLRSLLTRSAAATTAAAATATTAAAATSSSATAATTAAANVQRICYDFYDKQFDASATATHLQQQLTPGPALIIFDELDVVDRPNLFRWLLKLRRQVPGVCLWAAGIWRLDASLAAPLPPWVEVQTMQEPLRCPPTVVRELKQTGYIRGKMCLPYIDPLVPLTTQGPQVKVMPHAGHQGHHEDPLKCVACADTIGRFLKHELHVGQPGQELQYKDVWILYTKVPRSASVLVQRLQNHHQIPVREIPIPGSQDDQRDLALAESDQVLVVHFTAVQGLERRVVVAAGKDSLESLSRCTGCLCVLDV